MEDNGKKPRDTWTTAAVMLNIAVTLSSVTWLAAKNDQRLLTAERDIQELQRKYEKDVAQDIQIATITVQLAAIQEGVSEIKTQLRETL